MPVEDGFKPSRKLEDALVTKALAEAKKFESEAASAASEANLNKESLRIAKMQTDDFGIDYRQKKRIEQELLALDSYHNTYRFGSEVSEEKVKACIDKLTYWRRTQGMNAGGVVPIDVEIVFNSPGGDVIAGMDLFDFIQEMKRDGHTINTHTRGMAASMGGILLQAGNTRSMGREAYILIHEVSTGAFGKIGEIEDEVKFMKMIGDRVLDIFAARCAEAKRNGTATDPLTKGQIKSRWERKDWWVNSTDALRFGLVDKLR